MPAPQKKRRRGRGEGSVTFNRAKNLWQASVQIGLDENGKQKRIYVSAKRKETVLERLREIQGARGQSWTQKSSSQRVSAYLDQWLESTCRPWIREGTYQNYRGLIANKIRPYIGGYRLLDLDVQQLQSLFATLERNGDSPYRRQQMHSLLFSALRHAVEQRLILSNPCQAVRSPRIPSREMHFLDERQAKKLLEVAHESRLYALYVLALATGMRQGELFALKWSDVELKKKTVSVQRTVANALPKGVDIMAMATNAPKTKSSRRLIRLPDLAVNALLAHKRKMSKEQHLTWVFCDTHGGLLRRSNFNRRHWRPLIAEVNKTLPEEQKLPARFRFHDLRHTAATMRLAQGDHPKVVQELLGHARIAVTLDLYSHVMPTLQAESAEKIDRTLERLVPPD